MATESYFSFRAIVPAVIVVPVLEDEDRREAHQDEIGVCMDVEDSCGRE